MRRKAIWIFFLLAMPMLVIGCVYLYWQQTVIPLDRSQVLIEDRRLGIDLSKGATSLVSLSYHITQLPEHGWLSGDLPQITYHPRKDYSGLDGFRYSVTTEFGDWYEAEIHLEISPTNDLPTAEAQQVGTQEDSALFIKLSASDPDSDSLSFRVVRGPKHGLLTGKVPDLKYMPSADFFGNDRIIFQAEDQEGSSAPAEIKIDVSPVNDPPLARDITAATYKGFPITIEPRVYDPDNSGLISVVLEKPGHGAVRKAGPGFLYQPNSDYIGKDRFTYRSFDGKLYSEPAEVSINVYPFKGAQQLTRDLNRVITKGGVAIGSSSRGGYIFQPGSYRPASVLKLVTASAALYYLGDNARFETDFYRDNDNNLYIKGYGDPSLTTSEWHRIAAALGSKGLFDSPIPRIVLDDSAIEKGIDFNGRGRTIHYFDAPLGALASNYNTAEVNIRPGHQILPWKNKTPLTDISRKRARGLPLGYHKFSIAAGPERGTRYSGELAREIFLQHGLKNRPIVEIGTVPAILSPFYIHDSSLNLHDIVRTMLADSSNFIANQLVLTMAINQYGEPARLSQGVEMLGRYLNREQGLDPNDYSIIEGSGLSRQNWIDLAAMLRILNRFSSYRSLLPPLTRSRYIDLIRIGKQWPILAKTGTMKGVYTLAGYLQQAEEKWLPFVIMLEGKPEDRAEVLRIICRFFGNRQQAS